MRWKDNVMQKRYDKQKYNVMQKRYDEQKYNVMQKRYDKQKYTFGRDNIGPILCWDVLII